MTHTPVVMGSHHRHTAVDVSDGLGLASAQPEGPVAGAHSGQTRDKIAVRALAVGMHFCG